MSQIINIYCDESCHCENDLHPIMVLGAMWCPLDSARRIATDIRNLKEHHSLNRDLEIKWTKVSPAKVDFYKGLVDYFFDDKDLHFRAIIANKRNLKHEVFNQNHDIWYYKMYYDMLKILIYKEHKYRIYIDIKDTNSASRLKKLHKVLCNGIYDFNHEIIERVQPVRSHEIAQIQMADLFIGAISYINRGDNNSKAKVELIRYIQQRSGYSLTDSVPLIERKFNIFRWEAQEV